MAAAPAWSNEYYVLVFLKWRLMTRALRSSLGVLFLDADVLLIRDLFPDLEAVTTPVAPTTISRPSFWPRVASAEISCGVTPPRKKTTRLIRIVILLNLLCKKIPSLLSFNT